MSDFYNVPDEIFIVPGEILIVPGDFFNVPGEILIVLEHFFNVPGEILNDKKVASFIKNLVRDIKKVKNVVSRSRPATPKIRPFPRPPLKFFPLFSARDDSPDGCLTVARYTAPRKHPEETLPTALPVGADAFCKEIAMETRLTRRQTLLALAYSVAAGALSGCGGGNNSGTSVAAGRTAGRAVLPTGFAPPVGELRLFSGVTDTGLSADAAFTIDTLTDSPTLATLLHNDKPVLFGFLDPQAGSPVLDSTSSAVALLFFALGGWQMPTEQRGAFLRLVAAHPAAAAFAQVVAQRHAADPYALVNQDAQVVAALQTAVQSIAPAARAARVRAASVGRAAAVPTRAAAAPTRAGDPAPLLALAPLGVVNGMEVVQDGDLQPGFSIINSQRRARRVHLYRVGITDTNDVETRYPTAVGVGDSFVVPSTQKLGLVQALGDVLNATAPWSPVQSSRVTLKMEPNAHKTFYEIVALSPAFGSSEPSFFSESRYASEVANWRKEFGDLNEAVYFELTIAIFLEALGMGGLKYGDAALGEAIANIKNVGGNDVISLLTRARGGEPLSDSLIAFVRLVASSDILSTRYLTAMKPIVQIANAQLASDAQLGNLNTRSLARFRTALRVLMLVGLIASGVDIGAQVHDLNGGDRATLTTATLYTPSVRLNPASSQISPGDSVTFSANVPGAVGTDIVYAWSLAGSNLAVLSESGGQAGTSFETKNSVATLATTPSTVGTITVTVQAYGVQTNGSRKSLGTASGTVKVSDDVPFGTIRIQFNSLNANGAAVTGETRSMVPYQGATYQLYQNNPVVNSVNWLLKSTGKHDDLRLQIWFENPEIKAGQTIAVSAGSNSSLTMRLQPTSGNDVIFTAKSGTLTVLAADGELGRSAIKFKLVASLRNADPNTTADVTITGWIVGIVKA